MIDKLRRLVLGAGSTPDEPDTGGGNDFEMAAAALLVEAASIDGNFDDAEYATIARLLAERFDLSPDGVRTLIEEAHGVAEVAGEYGFRLIETVAMPNNNFSLIFRRGD